MANKYSGFKKVSKQSGFLKYAENGQKLEKKQKIENSQQLENSQEF